jgi:hypothetical protein
MPRLLRLAVPATALLLLAAHFFRAGLVVLAAGALASIALLFVSGRWAVRLVRGILLLGSLEWLRTARVIAGHRVALGEPYGRMLLILGAVAALTMAAALLVGRGHGGEKATNT